jgi:hypothetical protein
MPVSGLPASGFFAVDGVEEGLAAMAISTSFVPAADKRRTDEIAPVGRFDIKSPAKERLAEAKVLDLTNLRPGFYHSRDHAPLESEQLLPTFQKKHADHLLPQSR